MLCVALCIAPNSSAVINYAIAISLFQTELCSRFKNFPATLGFQFEFVNHNHVTGWDKANIVGKETDRFKR